ncbi:MAG: TetR/AcrR family transcriptional regulator [Erysipelothrix sp.]|jgi:AcrR family transcriptional regulator|nr:TetR/AcrR family transcriptional regulator [Erysipelothrix sp.]
MPATTKFSKETIIEAAFNVACQEGLDHMTIRLIAKRMGSSIAPLYVNFESVEDLKKAVMDKAQTIFHSMIKALNHDDLFLRYAIASISFSKKYPKIYNYFLLNEDNPLDSEKNVNMMLTTLRENPTYDKFDKDSLMKFIISMQALQVGLSIIARKSFYQPYLKEKDLVELLDKTGLALINNLLKNMETNND